MKTQQRMEYLLNTGNSQYRTTGNGAGRLPSGAVSLPPNGFGLFVGPEDNHHAQRQRCFTVGGSGLGAFVEEPLARNIVPCLSANDEHVVDLVFARHGNFTNTLRHSGGVTL